MEASSSPLESGYIDPRVLVSVGQPQFNDATPLAGTTGPGQHPVTNREQIDWGVSFGDPITTTWPPEPARNHEPDISFSVEDAGAVAADLLSVANHHAELGVSFHGTMVQNQPVVDDQLCLEFMPVDNQGYPYGHSSSGLLDEGLMAAPMTTMSVDTLHLLTENISKGPAADRQCPSAPHPSVTGFHIREFDMTQAICQVGGDGPIVHEPRDKLSWSVRSETGLGPRLPFILPRPAATIKSNSAPGTSLGVL